MYRSLLILVLFMVFVPQLQGQKEYMNRRVVQQNNQGYLLMIKEKKYSEALALFNQALKTDPEAYFIYQNRALCYLRLNDTVNAIDDFNSNLKFEPDNPESLYGLGNIYKKRNDTANAVFYFQKAIDYAGKEYSEIKISYMNNYLGDYYRIRHIYDMAINYYNVLAGLKPDDPEVMINRAACYYYLDSLELFCQNLENAYRMGGIVNCFILESHCKGCDNLEKEVVSNLPEGALDFRLKDISSDTLQLALGISEEESRDNREEYMKKIYFNKYWQVCLPDEAAYYRIGFWAPRYNYFGGDYTDYYIDSTLYATGRIMYGRPEGKYKCYYKNGNIKEEGTFSRGRPYGQWTYYLENGEVNFQINFRAEKFKLKFVNPSNPNFIANSGNGEFRLILDQWDDFIIELTGEIRNDKYRGEWYLSYTGTSHISALYDGEEVIDFNPDSGLAKVRLPSARLTSSLFIPPRINQVSKLFFASSEVKEMYPFIQKQ